MGRFDTATVASEHTNTPHSTIVTGRPSIGKTHLMSTIEGIFLVPIERGLKGCSKDHVVNRFVDERGQDILPRNFRELREAVPAAIARAKSMGLRHIGFDGMAGFEKLINKQACGNEHVAHMGAKDFKAVWDAAMPLWQQIQDDLDTVLDAGLHVWIAAHAAEAQMAAADGTLFSQWDLQFEGAGKTLVNMRCFWRKWADHVLFLDWDTQVKAGKVMQSRATGVYKSRIIYTRETPSHFAKNRGGLPPILPATWEDLKRALKAGTPATDTKLKAQIQAIAKNLNDEHRGIVEADLAKAKTNTALSACLSRAQGFVTVERQDEEDMADVEQGENAPAAKPVMTEDDGDLPVDPIPEPAGSPPVPVLAAHSEDASHAAAVQAELSAATTVEGVTDVYKKYKSILSGDAQKGLIAYCAARKAEIQQAA